MTPNQLQVLDFVRDRVTASGYAPTIREICAEFSVGVSTTHRVIDFLVQTGHLARNPNEHRGLRVVETPNLQTVATTALRAELARRGVTLEALMPREAKAFGREVSCAADTCGNVVTPGMLMCRTHWFALPRELQDRIKHTFSRRDVAGYQAAVTEARDLIDSGSWRRSA